MLLTEQEAKEKLCMAGGAMSSLMIEHHRREQLDGVQERVAARAEPLPLPRCQGSACMMWRRFVAVEVDESLKTINAVDKGFCGLAGRPPGHAPASVKPRRGD